VVAEFCPIDIEVLIPTTCEGDLFGTGLSRCNPDDAILDYGRS
jgi:hypothetical protein